MALCTHSICNLCIIKTTIIKSARVLQTLISFFTHLLVMHARTQASYQKVSDDDSQCLTRTVENRVNLLFLSRSLVVSTSHASISWHIVHFEKPLRKCEEKIHK